ncbi:MAG: hypothetical protein NZ700_11430 [Gemmataceae bacterium]|nr:hypothetical protein [Gemmataceae bacterium]MDW8265155.1 hypothetical protein [Gemmataceae bacterium]
MPIRTVNEPRAAHPEDVAAPETDNTPAVVYYPPAGATRCHVLGGVAWSYSGVPLGGQLTIEDGSGRVVRRFDITEPGLDAIGFDPPLKGSPNTALILTLAAAGPGVFGKLNALSHWTE